MPFYLTKTLVHLNLLVILRQILPAFWLQAIVDAKMDLRPHHEAVVDAPKGLTLVCCDYPVLLYHIIISLC